MLSLLIWAVIVFCVYIAVSDVRSHRKIKRKQRIKDKELKIAIQKIKSQHEEEQQAKNAFKKYNIELRR